MAKSKKQPFLAAYPLSRRESLLALATLLLSLIIFRLDLFTHFSTHYIGGVQRDAGLYVWLTEHAFSFLLDQPWFDTDAFYPYGNSLAWADNFILPSFIAAPFLSAGFSLVKIYNALILLSQLLTGFITFLLLKRLSNALWPCVASGVVAMLIGHLAFQMGHPQLQFAFFIPLAALCFFWFLENKSIVRSIVCGLVLSATFLTTVYYALFIVLLLAALCFALILLRPKALSYKEWGIFVAGSVIGALPMIPFVVPYLEVREAFGGRRLYESYYFAANLLSYFSASAESLLYRRFRNFSHAEAYLFPGFILYILTAFGIGRSFFIEHIRIPFFATLLLFVVFLTSSVAGPSWNIICGVSGWLTLFTLAFLLYSLGKLEREHGADYLSNRSLIAIFSFVAFVFLFISFGPIGNVEKGEVSISLFRVIYELVPGMNSLRAVSRTGLVTLFALVWILPFAFLRLPRPSTIRMPAIAVLSLLIILENQVRHLPLEAPDPVPSVIHYLEENSRGEDVATCIPFTRELKHGALVKSWGDFAELNVRCMQRVSRTKAKTVNGYSGLRSIVIREFPRKVSGFPDERSFTALSTISNLRWIVFDSSVVDKFDEDILLRKAEKYKSSIRFVMADEDGLYLFEFIHGEKLNEAFFTRVPNRKNEFYTFSLLSPKKGKEEELVVDLFIDSGEYKDQFAFAAFPKDGAWHQFSVPVIEGESNVKPLIIRYKARSEDEIYIRTRPELPEN